MNIGRPLPESAHGRPRVALIAGPTASGKSDVALALARLLPCTIINADASQVYADIPILSAAPAPAERNAAPHALYGYIPGELPCSAARWAQDARAAIQTSLRDGRLPVLVGGSGLYIRTLIDGISEIPSIDADIRNQIRTMPTPDAYQALTGEDPHAAARLNPADSTRIARALEVVRSTGQPLHHWHRTMTGGIGTEISLSAMIILPPREWLYQRIATRFATMIETGAIDEVRTLLAKNLPANLPVMRAIGVPEVARFIQGECTAQTAMAGAVQASRNYAKRQYTWFRNQSAPAWHRHEDILNADNIDNLAILLQQLILT